MQHTAAVVRPVPCIRISIMSGGSNPDLIQQIKSRPGMGVFQVKQNTGSIEFGAWTPDLLLFLTFQWGWVDGHLCASFATVSDWVSYMSESTSLGRMTYEWNVFLFFTTSIVRCNDVVFAIKDSDRFYRISSSWMCVCRSRFRSRTRDSPGTGYGKL